MKKITFFILIISAFSCSTTKYVLTSNNQYSALVLGNGKWILNTIDCPSSVYGTLQPLATKSFKILLQDSLYNLASAKGIIIPEKIRLQPSKATLQRLKLGTKGYDYFINIQAKKVSSNLGGLDIDNPIENVINPHKMNQSEATVEVYDLNSCEIIYSKTVVGSNAKAYDTQFQDENGMNSHQVKRSDSKVSFQSDADRIIIGSFKKIMRDINKKALKQKSEPKQITPSISS